MENALPLALYHNTTWTVGFLVGTRADIYRIGMSRGLVTVCHVSLGRRFSSRVAFGMGSIVEY